MTRTLAQLALSAALVALAWLLGCGSNAEPEQAADETLVAVQVGEIHRATLRRYVTAYGRVEPAPASAVSSGGGSRLAAPAAGVVSAVLCSEGDRVAAGDALFRLDSRVADVEVEHARREAERERKLIDIGGTSEKSLLEVERQLSAALARRSLLRIDAPFAGIVARVFARPGESVAADSVLAELIDPDRLVAIGGVPAAELDGLQSGQQVEITSSAGTVVDGVLSYVSPWLDSKTGLASIRATLPPGSSLRAGEFVELRIVSEVRAERMTVPIESVFHGEGGDAIAVVEGDRAVQVPVVAGLRDRDVVEIDGEGLKPGMRVVTVGAYGLPAQTRVRIVGD